MGTEMDHSNITIRNVSSEDIIDLFQWRNHPEVRRNSFNENMIGWDEHENWFKAKSRDPNTPIYIACHGDQKIGSIRFECKGNIATVSVMLNPDFFGKRLAALVIRLGTEKFISEKGPNKTIIAEIKRGNVVSARAFQRAGFKESYVTYVFNRK
jgi:UDP-2,4-diacetamido-2,4,6-trideoxy-beta-L-altropyranose hydrolase